MVRLARQVCRSPANRPQFVTTPLMNEVILYTRPGCGLCDDMKRELVRRGYTVREVDIEQDEALLRRYMLDIPVAVRPDGSVLARHRLDH
jgi:hypothetical protein